MAYALCDNCEGRGVIANEIYGAGEVRETCTSCNGTGFTGNANHIEILDADSTEKL